MQTITLSLPTMYGDHHVLEVRRILLNMPGVQEVYASSCFQIVQVSYDPAQLDAARIRAALVEAGYSEDLTIPTERRGIPYEPDRRDGVPRHTAAYEQTGSVISFAQTTDQPQRALWPCPGLGVIKTVDGGDSHA